jgi:hypothetical protein
MQPCGESGHWNSDGGALGLSGSLVPLPSRMSTPTPSPTTGTTTVEACGFVCERAGFVWIE